MERNELFKKLTFQQKKRVKLSREAALNQPAGRFLSWKNSDIVNWTWILKRFPELKTGQSSFQQSHVCRYKLLKSGGGEKKPFLFKSSKKKKCPIMCRIVGEKIKSEIYRCEIPDCR